MDGQLVAVLDHPLHLVDLAEIQTGIHALGEQVERQSADVDVAGPLAVAEQGAFDPVRARHEPELGGGHSGAPVVVGVQRQHDHRCGS